MGRKYKNGITDNTQTMKNKSSIYLRNRLLKLTKIYNKSFTSDELDRILNSGTFDYFFSSINKEPKGAMEISDSKLMNDLYNKIRNEESIKHIKYKNVKKSDNSFKSGGETLDLPTQNIAILFLDIKSSSKLWGKGEENMFKALNILDKIIVNIVEDNKGMIVKTIGDAFMCSYTGSNALINAVKSSYDIQNRLLNKPIKVGNDRLSARIGISYGGVYVKDSEIQGRILKDYFGNVVNTASRMESKVSSVDGFAFSFLEKVKNQNTILNFLKDKSITVNVIEYTDDCKKDDNKKRSGRLLTDLQIKECKDLSELHGVNSVIVYKCELPKKSKEKNQSMRIGGEVNNKQGMVNKNEEINLLLAKKGLNREKYSAMELKTITNYSYPTKLISSLVNKMWGLAYKCGFGGFGNKNIQVFNSGDGEILRFIPDSVNAVDVYEKDSDLYTISSLLFASDKVKIHKRLSTMKHHYDISIGVCGGLNTIINPDIIDYIKQDGLLIAVVNSNLFESGYEKERSILNNKFTLLEAYRLPSDIMEGYDLIALKKK